MTVKRQINIRASALMASQLAWLADRWGATQTEALTVCIDRIYRQEQATLIEQIVTGQQLPATGYPTDGETFYYHNDEMPLTDIGRVPGQDGRHVLRRPDGSLVIVGGYHLRRPGETWPDALNV